MNQRDKQLLQRPPRLLFDLQDAASLTLNLGGFAMLLVSGPPTI
jgi:hypothetical protein